MTKLTHRQKLVLEFIKETIAEQGFPPTLRQIGRRLAITSTNGVNDHLNALEKKGFLLRTRGRARGLRLIGDDVPEAEVFVTTAKALREENTNLREILRRVAVAVEKLPRLTAEMAVLAGDIRSVLGSRAA